MNPLKEILLDMEQTKSFFELAEDQGSEITVFEPDYTSEFKDFLEESIRQSDSANRAAITSASSVVINC